MKTKAGWKAKNPAFEKHMVNRKWQTDVLKIDSFRLLVDDSDLTKDGRLHKDTSPKFTKEFVAKALAFAENQGLSTAEEEAQGGDDGDGDSDEEDNPDEDESDEGGAPSEGGADSSDEEEEEEEEEDQLPAVPAPKARSARSAPKARCAPSGHAAGKQPRKKPRS